MTARKVYFGGTWVDLGGGGGGTPAVIPPDNSIIHPLNGTHGDEMTGGAISGIWTKRNIAEAETTQAAPTGWQKDALRLTFDASGDLISQTIPATDFEAIVGVRNQVDLSGMLGIATLDGSGTGIGILAYDDGKVYSMNIVTYAYSSTGNSKFGFPSDTNPIPPYWLSLKKVGTAITGRFSLDGVTWTTFTTTSTLAVTPTQLVYGRFFTGGGTITADLTRFNVYPTPGFYVP